MGNINKYSNLYNKDNELIKSVSDKGILTDYSIKELEELVDSLEDGNAKSNAMSMLQKMYTNPKTDADKEYVKKLQEELIKNMMANKANASTDKEEVTKSLGEVEDALTEVIDEQKQEEEIVDTVGNVYGSEKKDEKINTDDEYIDYKEVEGDFSNKMDNDIRQTITDRENNK